MGASQTYSIDNSLRLLNLMASVFGLDIVQSPQNWDVPISGQMIIAQGLQLPLNSNLRKPFAFATILFLLADIKPPIASDDYR